MGTGAKNRAVQAGLPIVLAVLVATALLPAPASADHGEPHAELDLLCDGDDGCRIVDYCKPAIVHVCVELGNVHGSISAAPLDPAFYVKVDSYKKSTPTGPVNLSCVVIKAGIDGPNTWLNECSLVLGTLGFWYDHTVIPWTGAERSVSKTDPLDDPAERTPIVELCSAEVGAWVAGTGTSETVKNVPCGLA